MIKYVLCRLLWAKAVYRPEKLEPALENSEKIPSPTLAAVTLNRYIWAGSLHLTSFI